MLSAVPSGWTETGGASREVRGPGFEDIGKGGFERKIGPNALLQDSERIGRIS